MMESAGLSASDVAVLTGNANNRGCNDGGNGMWGDWIWIILLFFLFGWGNNGNGFGNNGGSNGPGFQGWATRADINEGFALNDIQNGIRGVQQGLCDTTYSLNNTITNGFSNNQIQLCNGFNGVQQSFNQLGYQMQDCCCQTQRAIDGVNYNMATQACDTRNTIQNTTRDILDNNNSNTRAILDFLTQDKISTLQAENQSLKFQASQNAQNGYIDSVGNSIIARLQQPSPIPAYTVPAPYPYVAGCGCNTGYGCGC